MHGFPIRCDIKIRTGLPLMELLISSEKQQAWERLMQLGIELIDKAKKYNGLPIQTVAASKVETVTNKILVQLVLIFPSLKELKSFLGNIV